MAFVRGLVCRACQGGAPQAPVHVCEQCFGPLEIDYYCCAPIVTMIREGRDVLIPVRPRTIAKSLAIGNRADGYHAAAAVRDSGGFAAAAGDEEILEAMELLARTEGIFAETAGGVTLAAARTLVAEGRIGRDEPVVLCITGSGLKTVDALEPRLAAPIRVSASVAAVEAALPELQGLTTC
jgi:threonine synthase